MAKLRCGDCGNVFESNLQECPSCGCPASACSNEPEQPQTTHHTNTNTGSSVTQETPPKEIPELSSPMEEKRKMHPFEIACYCLAVICAILFLLSLGSTTSGRFVNFDGSNQALRHEIAAFGWLIVGRLTGILNK